MLPKIKVKNLISKHAELEKELSSGEIDKKSFAEKSKEYSELNEIINEAKEYMLFEKNKVELEKIINDTLNEKDIKDLAEL
jgi:peptide chain release factor 1